MRSCITTKILNGFCAPVQDKPIKAFQERTLNKKNLATIIKALQHGTVVGVPTETVYGLAADAENNKAVAEIFRIKNRPIDHPLIIHVAHIDDYQYWAMLDDKIIAKRAEKLVHTFWPGPLTIVLPRHPGRADIASSGHHTLAIRCPQHSIFTAIAQHFHGLAAPSANLFGSISPTTAQHVLDDLTGKIPFIIDGGMAQNGLESTVVSCLNPPRVLRLGPISPWAITKCLGEKVYFQPITSKNTEALIAQKEAASQEPCIRSILPSGENTTTGSNPDRSIPLFHHNKTNVSLKQLSQTSKTLIKTSGQFAYHYAPKKPLYLIEHTQLPIVLPALFKNNQKIAVLTSSLSLIQNTGQRNHNILWFSSSHFAQNYAQSLYQNMRVMDRSHAEVLLIIKPEHHQSGHEYNIWMSIYDRLIKASTPLPEDVLKTLRNADF